MGAFDAWLIPGWTAQNPTWLADPTVTTGVVLPADLTTVTVTGNYVQINGIQINGRVSFQCITDRIDTASGTVVLGGTLWSKIDKGALSVSLPATNDPDATPSDLVYNVIEHFPGGRKFKISVPFDAVSPVDINTLVVP